MGSKEPKGFGAKVDRASRQWYVLRRYHPYRYIAYRPWASKVVEQYREEIGAKHLRLFPEAKRQQLESDWLLPKLLKQSRESLTALRYQTPYAQGERRLLQDYDRYLQQCRSIGATVDPDHPGSIALQCYIDRQISEFTQWSSHTLNQRAIFEFVPELTSLFLDSDVSQALPVAVKLPFPTVYLHFGRQDSLPIRGDRYIAHENEEYLRKMLQNIRAKNINIDPSTLVEFSINSSGRYEYFFEGAYVSAIEPEGSLQITLVGSPNSYEFPRLPFNPFELEEEVITQEIIVESDYQTIGEILEIFKQKVQQEQEDSLRLQERALAEDSMHHIKLDDGDGLQNAIESGRQRQKCFANALTLVINGLLYISSYPDELQDAYPKEAPQELVQRALNSSLSAFSIDYHENQLELKGFRRVKLCGAKERERLIRLARSSSQQRTFMGRRGTWRFLQHPRYKTPRNIWIRPIPDPTGLKQILTIYDVHPT